MSNRIKVGLAAAMVAAVAWWLHTGAGPVPGVALSVVESEAPDMEMAVARSEAATVVDEARRLAVTLGKEEISAPEDSSGEIRTIESLGKHSSEVRRALKRSLWAREKLGLPNPTSTARIPSAEVASLLRDFYEIERIDKGSISPLGYVLERRFQSGSAIVIVASTPEELDARTKKVLPDDGEGYVWEIRGREDSLEAIYVSRSDPEVADILRAEALTWEGYVVPALAGLIKYFIFD